MERAFSSSDIQTQSGLDPSLTLEYLPISLCILNSEGLIQQANNEAYLLTGLTSAELSGIPLATLFHKSNPKEFLQKIKETCISPTVSLKARKRLRLKNDSSVWVNLDVRLLKSGSGAEYYVCTFNEVKEATPEESESKPSSIRAKLKVSEARFQSVAQALEPRIFQLDIDGIITYTNRTSGRIVKGDFIGTSIFNFLSDQKAKDVFRSFMDTCIHTKEGVSYQDSLEYEGEIRYYFVQLSPVISDGEVVGFALIRNDISDIKRAQQELVKTNLRLSSIVAGVNATGIGMFECDLAGDGKLIWDENTHQLFGVNPGEFDGRRESFEKMIHRDDVQRVKEEIKFTLENLNQNSTNHRIVRVDTGEVRWILTRRIITRNPNGDPVTMTGVLWDITDEKEQEALKLQAALLKSQNRELKEFTYIASHDLQSPLRTLNNYVSLLEDDTESKLGEDAKWYLSVIKYSTDRMKDLIQDLLTYSRIGKYREKTVVDLNLIIREVTRDLQHEIEDSGATIEIGNLPTLLMFETESRLLFQNLLSNAIKYRRSGISLLISIEAEKVKDVWRISMTDNGIGIEPQYFEKIFMVFQRLHDHTEFEGNGIGLAHCLKIAQLHEGTISVESEPGLGSSFTLEIPENTET